AARRRYWGRSLVGWRRIASAVPGPAHRALARLEAAGRAFAVITQNVDGLHQKAGSRRVLDLHGRLDEVECLDCGGLVSRRDVQALLEAWNPGWAAGDVAAAPAPDGDARVERDFEALDVPDCPSCGGVLKPRVVFFGESVPRPRVDAAYERIAACDAV